MRYKYYQFHFAEKEGSENINIGILNCKLEELSEKKDLIEYTRAYLKNPDANIIITHITKLRKSEYEDLTGDKIK